MAALLARLLRSGGLLVSCVVVSTLIACGRDPIEAPAPRSIASPAAAKSSTALAVTSTSPAFGDQGTTIDVHILGSGFTAGAKATWLLHGVADDHVHANSTTFISSSELVANITIASDATLDFWDVQVSLSNGKNGVGSDLFEVTSAEVLGQGTTGGDAYVYDISEQHQVVGYAGGGSTAFVYDDEGGLINLGDGQAMVSHPNGTLVAGKDGNTRPTIWTRQSPTNWIPSQLPMLANGIGGRVQAAARATDGTLLLAGYDFWQSTHPSSNHQRVVVWHQQGGQWTTQEYVLPAGASAGAANSINALGQVVGRLVPGTTGAVWDDPSTPVRLDGYPNGISADGRVIVGRRFVQNTYQPVYWWRDPATQQWDTTGVPLPTIVGTGCVTGEAFDVNTAGVIVGNSCNASGKAQATVWQLDLTGPTPVIIGAPLGLSGLGVRGGSETSNASAITETSPYVIAGSAASSPNRVAVRWRLQ